MTRDEELDWLYRLRSEIYVYMPKEWLIPMNNALDMAIKALEQEPNEVCDWFKQYIDMPSNTVLIEFSDGTSKRVKRGKYLANVENNLRRMMQVQIEREEGE